MPKISIIIPIYNAQDSLCRCIESCLMQSLKDIEIILVDDKSVDLSFQIAKDFGTKDSRVQVLQNPCNLGTFLARANGVKIARGEFILFLDADDYLCENALMILYDLAVQNHADIVHFGFKIEPFLAYYTKPKIHTKILENDAILGQIFVNDFKKSWLTLWGRMFSTNLVRSALKKLDFIDCHLISSEDSALFFMLCALAQKSIGVENILYIYTQNPNSLLKSKESIVINKQISDRTYIRDKFKENLVQFCADMDLTNNKYLTKSLQNLCDLMDYFICYSKRFLSTEEDNTHISPYIKYSLLSFKYIARWQIAIKLAIFLCSFGHKKL